MLPVITLAMLAGCAGHAPAPTADVTIIAPPLPSQAGEAAKYLARAKPRYQPPGPPGDPWGPYVTEASLRFDVPPEWIHEVMHVESGGYQYRANGELTTSPVGAMGLMQLMPETYDDMRAEYNLGLDAYEPHDNILAGTAYLRRMYDAFGAPAFLAAYNAGPARLQDYLVHNKPLPDETRRYVWLIGSRIVGVYPTQRSPAEQLAINQIPVNIPPGPRWVVHVDTRLAARARRRHEAAMRYAELHAHHHGRQSAPVEVAMALEAPVHPALARGGHWHLVTPAVAAEHIRPGGHHLAVHVGTYTHREHAVHATHAVVTSAHGTHATVYRAHVGGTTTHEGAVAACHHAAHHHHGAC